MSEHSSAQLSWCPTGIAVCNPHGHISFSPTHILDCDENKHELPHIPDKAHALSAIYLPMEKLLTRYFHFPLKHVRHLDAAMLSQELADTAGIEPDEWWLTWRAIKTEHGVSGLSFALPQPLKNAIQEAALWQQTPLLLIDGWERLNSWLQTTTENRLESFTVFDTDAEGLFFGHYQNGGWQGMRRLNGDIKDTSVIHNLSQQVLWSLQSMQANTESTTTLGRLTPELAAALSQHFNTQTLAIEHAPAARHAYNLTLAQKSKAKPLNLRHGTWSSQHQSSISRQWYRPALLTAGLCLLWLSLTTINNYQLETELVTMHEEITAAFHRGLPEQPVIIDALAQLRQAAHGSTTSNTQKTTQQLQYISETFSQQSWHMQAIKINKAGTTLSGKVSNLDTLNIIRGSLEKKIGANVRIIDTDLSAHNVTFRIHWQ